MTIRTTKFGQGEPMQIDRLFKEIRWQERVCVFIDNSNLFHAVKGVQPIGNSNLRNRPMDYIKFREFLADSRNCDVRFYYSMPKPPENNSNYEEVNKWEKLKKFYDGLEYIGYSMNEFPLRERNEYGIKQTTKEKGLDCGIVYDMAVLSRSGDYKTFVLVSGDEDYARTVRRIRNETGIQVEVAFFSHLGCSHALRREATKFIDLSQYINNIFKDGKPEIKVALVNPLASVVA